MNKDLRRRIVDMVCNAREGHIPSSFSIVDLVDHLYGRTLRYKPTKSNWGGRDFFILSKGHGAAALYVVLHKYGLISDGDLENYSKPGGVLGGHPEVGVPFIEASTGSLGHGLPMAVGLALGLKIQQKSNRVFVLVGDGECHEGTIWEAAHVATNLNLSNLVVLVDHNLSGEQLMPKDDLPGKWTSFGWEVSQINGHQASEIECALQSLKFEAGSAPKVIIADTIKGKGVSFIEGHGPWHHKIPSSEEYEKIMLELS